MNPQPQRKSDQSSPRPLRLVASNPNVNPTSSGERPQLTVLADPDSRACLRAQSEQLTVAIGLAGHDAAEVDRLLEAKCELMRRLEER